MGDQNEQNLIQIPLDPMEKDYFWV